MTYPPDYFEKCRCGDIDAMHRHGLELGREEGMLRQLERHLAEEQNPGRTVMVGPQEAVLDALERLADAASVEEEDWSPQTHDELVAALNEAGTILRQRR